jgi:cytochrome c556
MKLLSIILTTALLVLSQSAISADAEPDEAIKYRKNVMGAVGSNMKGMVAILKGNVDQKSSLNALADGFASAATYELTMNAFKQNTDGQGSEKTTSTAKLWEEWNDFTEALIRMEAASKTIQKLAASGELNSFEQLKPALKECGYCHRESGFRSK